MVAEKNEPVRRPGGAASSSESRRGDRAPDSPASNPKPPAPRGEPRRPVASSRHAPPEPVAPPDDSNRAVHPTRRTGFQRFRLALGGIAATLCLLLAGTVGYVNWRLGQISHVQLNLARASSGTPQNYLVVGSDSRAGIKSTDPGAGGFLNDPQYASNPNGAGKRSDTIMILRVDPSKESAQLLSFPRDLYVPIAGKHRSDKINAAFGAGAPTLIQTIQDEFKIEINHYVEIDFVGFQRLVDAVGGVPMYFDKPMWDGHTGLNITTVGCHTLNGADALAFARSRYLWYASDGQQSVDTSSLKYLNDRQMRANGWSNDGTSDLGRISRQQLLIRTAIPLAERKALRNPATLNAIIGSVIKSVTFDRGTSNSDLLGLAERFKAFDANSLVTSAFPTTPKTFPSGEQVLLPNRAEGEKILAKFRSGTTSPESKVSVDVLNASGVDGQAANVAGALQRVGFHITGTGNASTLGIDHLDHTVIRYAASDEAAARLLASHLTTPVELSPIAGMDAGEVVLAIGSDFEKVSTTAQKSQEAASPSTTTNPAESAPSSSVVGVVPDQADNRC